MSVRKRGLVSQKEHDGIYRKEILASIPETLEIDDIIREKEKLFRRLRLKKEKLLYICSLLLDARTIQRKQILERDGDKDWCYLNSKVLEDCFYDYKNHLQFLIEAGVVECNNYFNRNTNTSRGYRFASEYSGCETKEVKIEEYQVQKAIKRSKERHLAQLKKGLRGYEYLCKWWKTGLFNIDLERAFSWIDKYEISKIEDLEQTRLSKERFLLKRINARNTSVDLKTYCRRISEKQFRYRFSGEGHRFYSPISNLPKGLREYLSYNGKKLVGVDVKNSQPFFSLALFKKEENILIANRDLLNCIITFQKTFESEHGTAFEKIRYSDACTSGKFYEILQNETGISDRARIKKEVLTVFFANPQEVWYHFFPVYKALKKIFPATIAFFDHVKKEQHNRLAILLQRIESYVMLDVVCKKISELDQSIPLFPLHDAIITTVGNEALVKEIILAETKRIIGHEAKVEYEYFGTADEKPEILQIDEIWKEIPGYEGYYEISTTGRVRGLERKVFDKKGRGRIATAVLLKTRNNNRGYEEVRLSRNGKTSTTFVHILVAQTYLSNPLNKKYVNHKNGDKMDNRMENLEWVTHSENVQHAYQMGLIKPKCTPVIDTCSNKEYHSIREASIDLGISHSTLRGYLNGSIKNNPTCLKYA